MAAKTPIDKLVSAISDILEEYGDEITDNIGEIAEAMGKKGVQALRQESKSKLKVHTGDYARGWKMQTEKGRLSTTVTIYNDHYSLPHLLENGHVIRNGTGRVYGEVQGREHIAPVDEELVETFEREVVSKL